MNRVSPGLVKKLRAQIAHHIAVNKIVCRERDEVIQQVRELSAALAAERGRATAAVYPDLALREELAKLQIKYECSNGSLARSTIRADQLAAQLDTLRSRFDAVCIALAEHVAKAHRGNTP